LRGGGGTAKERAARAAEAQVSRAFASSFLFCFFSVSFGAALLSAHSRLTKKNSNSLVHHHCRMWIATAHTSRLCIILLPIETQAEAMRQAVKASYRGQTEKYKRIVVSTREKVKFDWDAKEDTSSEMNNLYKDKHRAPLMFGRGYIAGVDRSAQRKQNTFYKDMLDDEVSFFRFFL
jgi:hypothetical protein